MQRFVEDAFTVVVGAANVLMICAAVHYMLAGNGLVMVAAAIGAAVCAGWVQKRMPVNVNVSVGVPRAFFEQPEEWDDEDDDWDDDFSDVEPCDCEECNPQSATYPFSEN